MTNFAESYTQTGSAGERSNRQLSQREEDEHEAITTPPEEVTQEEHELLAGRFEKLKTKATKLAQAIEEASDDLCIPVSDTEVSEALRTLFPDDPTHVNGSLVCFQHYKKLLDRIEEQNDFRDEALLKSASENRFNVKVFQERQLSKAGVDESEIELLSSAFFVIQLAAAGTALFNAPLMGQIGLASTTNPNPAGSAVAVQATLLDAAAILSQIGAGANFLEEFMNRVGSIVDFDPGFDTKGVVPGGSVGIRESTFDAFKKSQEPKFSQRILNFVHKKLPSQTSENERFIGWTNYLATRGAKVEADMFGDVTHARRAQATGKFAPPDSNLERPLGSLSQGIQGDALKFAGNVGDSVEAGINFGRDLFGFFSDRALDLNTVLDSLASFMSTYYGPDSICCFVRLTGASINTDFIKALSGVVGLLNLTSSFDMTSALNKLLQDYNQTLDKFISRKILSRIEALFQSIINEVSRFIDTAAQSDERLNIILTCPPIADLIALLKQTILRLEDFLHDLVMELAELFRLNNININTTAEFGFESSIAGKLGRLLSQLSDILDDCTGSPGSRDRARQLVERIREVSRAPIPIKLNPGGDPFEDFVELPAIKTSRVGLKFDPGAQTRITKLSEATEETVLDSCVGGATEEEILKLAFQTQHIRKRFRDLENG